MMALRGLVVLAGLVAVWQAVVWLTAIEPFILATPAEVGRALIDDAGLLAEHAAVTLGEILLGLAFGTLLGTMTALTMASYRPARRWLLPVLVASQAIPVFALAPILVLWLGYGLWPKVAMATLIIYFPVAAAFFDGLRRTEPGWLDLARTMGAGRAATLWRIRVPAALPGLASGLRVATAVAPIGAVVGEWVGASAGLGHLMLHARARVETPRLFAALVVLAAMAVLLYLLVDRLLRRAMPWQADAEPADAP
jgi:putative hydroxymethylpyrimidine transport system permease protein